MKARWSLGCLLVAGMAGCGGDDPAPQGTQEAEGQIEVATATATRPAGEPRLGGYGTLRIELDSAQLARIRADPEASEYLLAVIDDGVLTFAEYQQSVFGYLGCAQRNGATIRDSDPQLDARGVYTWSAGWPSDPSLGRPDFDNLPRPEEDPHLVNYFLHLDCQDEAFGKGGQIEFWWKQAVAPTQQELQAAAHELAGCMEDGGLGALVPASRSWDDLQIIGTSIGGSDQGILAVWLLCKRDVHEKWAIPGFSTGPR